MHDFSHLSGKKLNCYNSIVGKPREHVKYFTFLGILFDENLTWKCLINNGNQ